MNVANKKYDYLIVGSGIFGATIANLLKNDGKKCLIVEKRLEAGGNLYCEKIEGINVHKYGAHIFHTSNKKVWDYVNRFVEFNHYVNSPIAIYKEELYNLPFNMNTFYQIFKQRDPEIVKALIENDKPNVSDPSNLEEQALSLVGKTIYEKLIKEYTEKQWGKKCNELPAYIIKRLPLRFTFNNNYFNDRYQGIPINGYNELIQKMLEGIEVIYKLDYLKEKEKYDNLANKIIYTGQIDRYFDYRYGELEYRSVRFETEIVNVPNYQGNAVVNYTDIDHPYTRIIEHKHFEKLGNDVYDNKKTVISKEYSQEWNKDIEPYYPINNQKNIELYMKYKNLAENEQNVYFGGRLAEYKYYDIDKTIESAFNLYDIITKS